MKTLNSPTQGYAFTTDHFSSTFNDLKQSHTSVT